MGDAGTALVLRHLEPLLESDREELVAFVRERDWQLHLQPGGPDSVQPLWPADPAPLTYKLPEFDLDLAFLPMDFIQVNAEMNRRMIARAVELLDPREGDRVLDLFCGLGNFTLPIATLPMDFIQVNAAVNKLLVSAAVHHLDLRADSRVLDLYCGIGNFTLAVARRAAEVTGVEGSAALVSRALGNARRNRVENVSFECADLDRFDGGWDWWRQQWDRLLLDPPRSGAGEVLSALGENLPLRIVYVSCNPESLARDAELLVHQKGYRLSHAGVIDMFPHTAHCEAMAVFDRPGGE